MLQRAKCLQVLTGETLACLHSALAAASVTHGVIVVCLCKTAWQAPNSQRLL